MRNAEVRKKKRGWGDKVFVDLLKEWHTVRIAAQVFRIVLIHNLFYN